MSLIRSCLIISAAVMLLPVEDKQQKHFTVTATQTAEQTAGYCARNPETCRAGSDLWATFVRKAEYGVELGAQIVRDQILRSVSEQREPATAAAAPAPTVPVQPLQPVRADAAAPAKRQSYTMDYPPRPR